MGKSTTQTTKENSQTQGTQDSQSWNYSPTYVQDAAKNLVATGTGMTAPFLNVPNFGIAGFTPDQVAGMDFARNIAQQRGENTYKWYQGARDYVGDATYKPVDAAAIAQFQNPFTAQAINTTRAVMDSDWRDKDAALAGRYASANAFGGSGEALARGTLAKGYGEQLASTTAQMQQQAYSQALQAALQSAAAAGASEDTRRARGMQGLQMGSALESEDLQRQLLGLQTLMGVGQQQQDLANQALQYPWGALSILAGLTPQDQTMTQYGLGTSFQNSQGTKKTESSGGGNILNGIAGLVGIGKGLGFFGAK